MRVFEIYIQIKKLLDVKFIEIMLYRDLCLSRRRCCLAEADLKVSRSNLPKEAGDLPWAIMLVVSANGVQESHLQQAYITNRLLNRIQTKALIV